jgi:hypothetical protein
MAIVDASRLRRFMSNPSWTPEQTQVAEDLCIELETGLEDALGGTRITPVPCAETARIVAVNGQVHTRFPVFSVTSLDGVAVAEDDPLPTGYVLDQHALYYRSAVSTANLLDAAGWVAISGLASWGDAWGGQNATNAYSGSVAIEYMAGWGAHPSLVNAILRKAAAFMDNRHSDVVVATGLDNQAPPKPTPEDWTDVELARLGRFRRLGGA